MHFLKPFFISKSSLYVTEFGHSVVEKSKTIGPWAREIYILHYVVRGTCAFSGFTVHSGQAFLITKGLRHRFTVSDDYEHYWIGFDGSAFLSLLRAFHILPQSHLLFHVSQTEYIKSLFIRTEKSLLDDHADLSGSVVLATLLATLPLLSTERTASNRRSTNYAEQVQRFIQTNYALPLRMADIAADIHLTEKHMCHIFRKRFGTSPQHYLQKTRMAAAESLLIKTDLAVNEIAASVGYRSLPSFCRTFADYFGIAPSAYRKNTQKTLYYKNAPQLTH